MRGQQKSAPSFRSPLRLVLSRVARLFRAIQKKKRNEKSAASLFRFKPIEMHHRAFKSTQRHTSISVHLGNRTVLLPLLFFFSINQSPTTPARRDSAFQRGDTIARISKFRYSAFLLRAFIASKNDSLLCYFWGFLRPFEFKAQRFTLCRSESGRSENHGNIK